MKQLMMGLVVAGMALSGLSETWKPKLALQLYSFRNMSFVDAVKTAKKIGFEYVEAYPGQKLGGDMEGNTQFTMDAATREKVKAFLKEQNIKLVNYGVCGAKDEAGWKQLFGFAKEMGIETLQVEVGKSDKDLEFLSNLSKETGIKVALHNHKQAAGFPEAMAEALAKYPEIGAGADTGHWMRAGKNALEGIKKLDGRIRTLHLVDVNMNDKGRDVPYGKGCAEIGKILEELKRQKFNGVLTCEYEHISDKLVEEVAECVTWYNNYFAK
jgi:sugar phosphate isomerase/epimerase